MINMVCSFVTSVEQRHISESATEIEPMASQILIGRSNHLGQSSGTFAYHVTMLSSVLKRIKLRTLDPTQFVVAA